MSDNIQVIVLGFHRSGTSMIAGCLHKLGVHMGDDLVLGSMPQNRKGYYEDRDFIDLSENILTLVKAGWSDPPDDLANAFAFGPKAEELIKSKDNKPFWGWKDPRTALILPVYLPYLSNPKFIVCKREKGASIASLNEREMNRFSIQELSDLYDKYQSRIIEYTPKFWIIYYEDFISNKDVEHLAHYIKLEPSDEQIKSAKDHIDDKLNRHRADEYRSFIRSINR